MTKSHFLLSVTLILTFATLTLASSPTKPYPSPYGDDPNSCKPTQFHHKDDSVPLRREVYGGGRIFDITHKYRVDMPSYGSPSGLGEFLWLRESIKNGSLANISEFKMLTHTGTHCDAPGHFYDEYFDAGFDIDSLDLEVLNAEVMESLSIPKGVTRVIFRTLNTDRRLMWQSEFDTSYVGFTKDGAKWLVENTDIKLVGTDYLSVAAYDDLAPGHLFFLKGRVRNIFSVFPVN
ncbi:hypothetical protein GIB67_008022 [Kingdonia uniflora]|uniref:Uncharacterized protein n=1 Tax=Kingdonia uniflora TaxID=39325 RepID=A0A7J7KV47_9MAGN|nr:hypothetical protein GIB67_008022 [Kingdonia uniflora]